MQNNVGFYKEICLARQYFEFSKLQRLVSPTTKQVSIHMDPLIYRESCLKRCVLGVNDVHECVLRHQCVLQAYHVPVSKRESALPHSWNV